MSNAKDDRSKETKVDYSAVTPATGTNPDNIKVADSLANNLPTADSPASERSVRSDPDKTIPGPEAASGVDQAEEERSKNSKK